MTLKHKHIYQSSWRQPESVDRWLREKAEGRVLNVCSGESPLGDVQVDADLDRAPDILADMSALPFSDASFDTVIFDPPWKMGYYQRQTPFFECVRVCKPNGRILMTALWVGDSENTVVEETVVRADDEWANISVIVEHRKQPGQVTLTNE